MSDLEGKVFNTPREAVEAYERAAEQARIEKRRKHLERTFREAQLNQRVEEIRARRQAAVDALRAKLG
jgi:hypothetical protein